MLEHAPHTIRCLRRFRRARRGATLIEFAILAPLFLLLLLGIMDFTLLMTKWVMAENAINSVSRQAIVNPTGTDMRASFQRASFGLINMSRPSNCVCARAFNNIVAANSANLPSSCNGNSCPNNLGSRGQYVLFEANFSHRFVTPLGGLLRILGVNGSFNSIEMTARTVLRNE